MKKDHTITEFAEIGTAPLLISGVLMSPVFLVLCVFLVAEPDWLLAVLTLYALLLGPGMLMAAYGVRKRWRHAWIPASFLCLFFLPAFPVGTLLCGWALYSLWQIRGQFYPYAECRPG